MLHGIFKRAKRVWGWRRTRQAELVERPAVVFTGEFDTYTREELDLLTNAAASDNGGGVVPDRGLHRAAPALGHGAWAARAAGKAHLVTKRPPPQESACRGQTTFCLSSGVLVDRVDHLDQAFRVRRLNVLAGVLLLGCQPAILPVD